MVGIIILAVLLVAVVVQWHHALQDAQDLHHRVMAVQAEVTKLLKGLDKEV